MTDLVLILISGVDLTQNLERSLEEATNHRWAFADWKRQMAALTPDTKVAYVELIDEQGRQVKRFTASNAVLTAKRVVLATVERGIARTDSPFHAGYPYEFSFDDITDEQFDPPLSLDETIEWLNDRVPGLELEPLHLPELVGHAKSNRIGVFKDGAPRKANYFEATKPEPGSSSDPPRTTTGLGEVASVPEVPLGPGASAFGGAVEVFAQAVNDAGLVFLGANSSLPRAFLAAVAAKRFVILSGLSGSGKTQLARALGQWLGSDDGGARYLVVPVRPDWTSPEPLLGYEDALLEPDGARRAWTAPAPLRFMLRAAADPDHLYLLVLDEMNLAQVERYFADVLSGIESGEEMLPALAEDRDGLWRVPDGQGLIGFPANLLVVGTVNVDETTHQFSPKVLDRAFTFDFRVGTSELGQATRRPAALEAGALEDLEQVRAVVLQDDWHLVHPATRLSDIVEQLTDLHRRLTEIGFEFGHRTFYEASRFAATLAAVGISEGDEALDWILMTKVLPRLHGSRRQLEPFLTELLETATGSDPEKPTMPRTARKTARMLDLVRANQFVSFAE